MRPWILKGELMVNISIITDNAAFHDQDQDPDDQLAARVEVARILKALALKLENFSLNSPKLRDYNGNAVGEIVLTGKERRWLS